MLPQFLHDFIKHPRRRIIPARLSNRGHLATLKLEQYKQLLDKGALSVRLYKVARQPLARCAVQP